MQYLIKSLILLVILMIFGCAGLQTLPTCQLNDFGYVDILNFTKEAKPLSYCKLNYVGGKCVGRTYELWVPIHDKYKYPPFRLRFHPGWYELKFYKIGVAGKPTTLTKHVLIMRCKGVEFCIKVQGLH